MSKEKWVRRFSVDETDRHKNGFTIYKITSVLFPIHSPEVITTVSVWKRYSDVQTLHKSMRLLHAGLHLRGTFPQLERSSYFKRFQREVIEERAKSIKTLLDFVAEHKLLFTSTDFVNFLQTGYPAPEQPLGVINTIRSSLHLPLEESTPLHCVTSDDDVTPHHSANPHSNRDETDYPISEIPIYEGSLIETRQSPKRSETNSIESIPSLESDLYEELNKITIDKKVPSIKVLPDLINFDAPSTSFDSRRSSNSDFENYEDSVDSRMSFSSRSVLSLSNVECRTRTEDSYVFEAGYLLNLAARCEDLGDYVKAFDCYKSGIEKMLIGVQTDTDQHRRALIKEKTNKYLAYAEAIYKNHLVDNATCPVLERDNDRSLSLPSSLLCRGYEELSLYRVLGIIESSVMLVLHTEQHACSVMKVIQKVPNNLTEFDEYILQNTEETKQPILPTNIPYMIPLHSYIETNNLIFLILAYAPGEKLFNYIKNYAKSNPNTPQREANLENVFTEPKNKNDYNKFEVKLNENVKLNESGVQINESGVQINESGVQLNESQFSDRIECNLENNNVVVCSSMSVDELVLNSQRLIKNVDRVLSEPNVRKKEDVEIKIEESTRIETPVYKSVSPRDVIPPSAICKWAAEILTALESLHNSGVICRDLNPSNLLLGDKGQVLLTYFYSYPDSNVYIGRDRQTYMYTAPELYDIMYECGPECDYWSYGVILYELLCGLPLSYYHRSLFTSHTILQLPAGLSVEVQSLLTQLLTYDPKERLGYGDHGIEQIKCHPYFKNIDWQDVYDSWIVPD